MRIGISAVLGTPGGPRTYARELVRALGRVAPAHEVVVFTDAPATLADLPAVRVVGLPMRSRYGRPWWDHAQVARAARDAGLDLFHGTKNVLPRGCAVPSVVTVHDLAAFLHPRTFAPLQRAHLVAHVRDAARRADRLIVPSERVGEELRAILGSAIAPAVAVAHGAPPAGPPPDPGRVEALRRRLGLGERVVLALGTVQPRKGLDTVLRAFGRVQAEGGLPHQLVIAGRQGWGAGPAAAAVAAVAAVGPARLVRTGPLADDELPALFAAAEVFVGASRYEGFGLAALEAMRHGVPVVSTPMPSLDEGGPGGTGELPYVRARVDDVESLAAGLRAVVDDAGLRRRLAGRGRRHAASFRWDRTAERTLAVYESAAGRRRG